MAAASKGNYCRAYSKEENSCLKVLLPSNLRNYAKWNEG